MNYNYLLLNALTANKSDAAGLGNLFFFFPINAKSQQAFSISGRIRSPKKNPTRSPFY